MMVREKPKRFVLCIGKALAFLILLQAFGATSLAGSRLFLQEESETAVEEDGAVDSADGEEQGSGEDQPEAAEGKIGFKGYFSNWNWLKWLHDTTEGRSRGTAQWFDGFFGSTQMEQQADVSFGRLSLGVAYDERRQLDPEFRFRARFVLPNVNNRFNVVVGRMDEDEFISDSYEGFETLPDGFGTEEENDWLLGFGYNPVRKKRSNLHFSVGAKLSWLPEPYVKGRYTYKFITGSRSQIRTRETVWWKSEEGVGASTQINFEYMPGQRHMIRWANGFEVSELADGLIWQSRLTLYQNLSDTRAMAYQIGARGETGKHDPIEYYGFRLVYRQNVLWDWFFLEAMTGVYWPRSETLEIPTFYDKMSHEAVPYISLGIEMFFGKGPQISKGIE